MTAFDGYRARWREADYAAGPDAREDGLWVRLYAEEPAEGFVEFGGRHVRLVHAVECTAEYWRTVCTWRGHPFRVLDERDDELLLEYTGGLLPVASRLKLERVERGVHRRRVPRAEVRDLHVEAVPLLGGG